MDKQIFIRDEESLAEAKKILQKATKEYDKTAVPILKARDTAGNDFLNRENQKIVEEHKCDCCRPRLFDYFYLDETGITLRMDADHPNDIYDRHWDWEQTRCKSPCV